jgi:hypothetical protein
MTRNRAAVSHRPRDRPFGQRPSTPIDERPTLFACSRHSSLYVRSAAPLPTATISVGTISSTGIGRGATDCASTPISHFLAPFAPTLLLLVSFAPRRAKVTWNNRPTCQRRLRVNGIISNVCEAHPLFIQLRTYHHTARTNSSALDRTRSSGELLERSEKPRLPDHQRE